MTQIGLRITFLWLQHQLYLVRLKKVGGRRYFDLQTSTRLVFVLLKFAIHTPISRLPVMILYKKTNLNCERSFYMCRHSSLKISTTKVHFETLRSTMSVLVTWKQHLDHGDITIIWIALKTNHQSRSVIYVQGSKPNIGHGNKGNSVRVNEDFGLWLMLMSIWTLCKFILISRNLYNHWSLLNFSCNFKKFHDVCVWIERETSKCRTKC